MQITLDTSEFDVVERGLIETVLQHRVHKYKIYVHTPDNGTDDIHFYSAPGRELSNFLFSADYQYCQFTRGAVYYGEYGFYWS